MNEQRLSNQSSSTGRSRLSSNSIGERAQKIGNFLLSGDSALRLGAGALRGITGGAVNISEEDIQNAPSAVRFISDTLLSPVGLASVALAPLTGGTSLGLKGALGVGAKLATRVVPELAVSAAATGASKVAENALGEDASPLARFGVGLAAGIAGGGAAAAGLRAGIANASPAVMRSTIRETAEARGLKRILGTPDYDAIKEQVGQDPGRMAQMRGILGIDPSANAEGVDRDYIALLRSFDSNDSLTSASLLAASPKGFRSFELDDKGLVKNLPGYDKHWNDLMEIEDAPNKFNMTPEQAHDWRTMHEVKDDVDILLKDAGIQRPQRELKAGEVYFPRGSSSRAGIRFDRPVDHIEERMWETATEAVASGNPTLYDTPAETMRLYVKTSLDEIALKKFDDSVLQQGVHAPAAARATPQGKISWYNLRDAGKAEGAASKALIKARSEGALPEEIASLEGALTAAQTKRNAAHIEWNKMTDKTWAQLPSDVVGRAGDTPIPVSVWRGVDNKKSPVFMAADQVDKLHEWFGMRGISKVNTPWPVTSVQQVGDLMRFMAATGDFAGPMIQGLPLLAHNPVVWGKMMGQNVKAFFKPDTQGEYVKQNLDSITEMIMAGVPIGNSEMFKALEQGGLGERVLRAPGLNKTVQPVFRRFQESYDTTVTIARHELWKALRPRWEDDTSSLARFIRNSTGGLDSKNLGVGGTQRALESMMLFAPRMLRSTLALVGEAARPWTPDGAEAAHTLMRLMAASAGIMAVTNIGVGIAANETEEEIDKRLEDTMNPLNGRQFLSVRVGDNWYGMGGQFRSAAQLLTRGITNPESLFEADSFNNPLIRYASGRISPVGQVGLAAAEYATGEKHNLLPYETVDDLPDVARLAGTGMMPFFVQSLIENDWSVAAPLAEMVGVRTALSTPKDILDEKSWRTYGMSYNDLTGKEQDELKNNNPKEAAKMADFGGLAEKQLTTERSRITRTTDDTLRALNTAYQNNELAPDAFRQKVQDTMGIKFLRTEEATRMMDIDFEAADSPKRAVMDAYFNTFTDAGYTPEGGLVNWDKWEELQGGVDARIANGEFGDPERAQKYLDERRRYQPPHELQWFFDNKKAIEDAGYWEQKELVFEKLQPMVQSMGYDFQSVNEVEQAYTAAVATGDPKWRQLNRILNRVQAQTDTLHQAMRRKVPGLERALFENGFIERPKRPGQSA